MITNKQAADFAVSLGWNADSKGYIIKKSHKCDTDIMVHYSKQKPLQETVAAFAKKYDSDKYAVELWERMSGAMTLAECMEIAEMFESDIQVLFRWFSRREDIIREHF